MAYTSMDDQERDTYDRFIAALKGDAAARIPRTTIYGAITHYLSTLSLDQLPDFLDTVIQAQIPGPSGADVGLRESFQLSPGSKLSHVEAGLSGSWLQQRRTYRQMGRWFDVVSQALIAAQASSQRTDCMLGLLKGIKGDHLVENVMSRSWTTALDEEIVLSVADLRDRGGMQAFSGALGYIIDVLEDSSLRFLDIKLLLTTHRQALFRDLDNHNRSELCTDHTRIIVRCFDVLDHGGPSSWKHAWTEMQTMLMDFGSFFDVKETSGIPLKRKDGTESAAITAFLQIGKCAMTSLQRTDPPGSPSEHLHMVSTDSPVPVQILSILPSLRDSTVGDSDASPSYYEVLNHCLDHLSATGSTPSIDRLFEQLLLPKMTPERAAFCLVLARELVRRMPGKTIRDSILPLCQEFLIRPEHQTAFEASHAFLPALFQAAAENSGEGGHMQGAMFEELALSYAALVLRQGQQGHLPSEEVVRKYALTCFVVGNSDPKGLQICIDLLQDSARVAKAPFDQTIRLCWIAAAPVLPPTMLSNHLEEITRMVIKLDLHTKERSDLVGATFEMVTRDLPDSTRRHGIQWWMRHGGTLRGDESTPHLQARL